MADGYEAFVEVLPDFRKLQSQANSQLTGILGSAGTAGGVAAGSNLQPGVLGGIKSLAAPIVATFAALGIGRLIGDAIGTGIRYSLDSVGLASDLSETRAAIGEVFGDASADIQAFAQGSAKRLGQTQQSVLTAAQTFGVFAKAAGLTGKPLSDFSTDLVTLSTDMASFFNADPSEVIEALGAGLRGESEPLRRFGVLLDDATLRARAMELGIYDGNGALSQQQRVLAAQAEIFAQTGIAQGDFARTSDGLANQQRILQSTFEETQTKLGEFLLPAFTTLTSFANDTLAPAIEGVVEKVGPVLGAALEESLPAIEDLVEGFAPLVEQFVVSAAEDGIPAFIDLMNEIKDEAPTWIDAFNTVDGAVRDADGEFRNFQDGLIGARRDRIDWFASFVDDVNAWAAPINASVNAFLAGIGGMFSDFFGHIGNGVAGIGQWFRDLPGTIIGAIVGFDVLLVSAGQSLIQGFIDGINSMKVGVSAAVGGLMAWVAGFFPHSPAKHGPLSGSGWAAIGSAGRAVIDQFASGMDARPELLGSLALPAAFSSQGSTLNLQAARADRSRGTDSGSSDGTTKRPVEISLFLDGRQIHRVIRDIDWELQTP